MRSLSIVMFTTFYPPYSYGGDAVGVQRMAQALVQRGHRVTVVHDEDAYLSTGGKEPTTTAPDDGVNVVGLRAKWGLVSNFLTHQTGHPVVHGNRIRDLLDAEKPDIIWHNNTSLVGGPGLLHYGDALKIYEAHEHWLVCPTHVLWKHNRELCETRSCVACAFTYRRPPQIWRSTGMIDTALGKMDLIIAKSEFSAKRHRAYGFKQDMTVLPYFLPDLDLSDAPPAADHARPYFLFVGRLEKIKGLQDVFPAFEGEGASDLIILGDGEYRSELERLAGGNPRVIFLGRKPLDELTAYYRGARGLIVPSVCYETFGIILIESFRLGTPVIARRLGPFPEIVNHADGGVLFETEADLRAAMARLEDDPAERNRQGQSARQAFEGTWREDRVLAAYGAELAAAANKSGDRDLAAALEAGAFENGSRA